jgi:hypothetical protein
VVRAGLAPLALVLMLTLVRLAHADEKPPVCLVPSVVDEMAREISQRDYYAHVDWRLVAEYPLTAPNSVWCGATVSTRSYDVYRFGGMPLWRCEQYAFSVTAVSGGFVVRYLRKGPWLPEPR